MNKIMIGDIYTLKNSYKNEHIKNVLVFSVEDNGKCLVIPLFSDWKMATDGDYWLPGPEWLDTRCAAWSMREVVDISVFGVFLGRVSSKMMDEIFLIESGKCSYEKGVPVLYGTGDMREKFKLLATKEFQNVTAKVSTKKYCILPLKISVGIAAVALFILGLGMFFKESVELEEKERIVEVTPQIEETEFQEIEIKEEPVLHKEEKFAEKKIEKPLPQLQTEEIKVEKLKIEPVKIVKIEPEERKEIKKGLDLNRFDIKAPEPINRENKYVPVSNTVRSQGHPRTTIEPLRTQLIRAVIANDIEKVKELLKQKADPFEMDRNGKSAFDFAKEHERKEILEMFEEVR